MATISRLSVVLTANTKRFRKGMRSATKTLKSFASSIFNIKTAIVGVVGVAGIGLIARNIINVNERMETLKSSLKTLTGSAKAAGKAFIKIEQFAITTPFDLEQVISAFIKLKALGLDPTEKSLTAFGNIASAMGKELNQMIEAVADAVTGEFERLKEFGIKAKSEGDKVTFTFQGVAKQVGKNAAEIEGYLLDIGQNTFGSAMADQMDNLKPAFSNLSAAFDAIKIKIGESGINRLVVSIVKTMTDFLTSISTASIERFVKAVVGMGFAMARSIVSMIAWIGAFISETGSLKSVWIGLKIGASEFADVTLAAFRTVSKGFEDMVRSLLHAALKLPEWLWGRDILLEGLHDSLEGAKKLSGIINKAQAAQAIISSGLRGDLKTQQRIDSRNRDTSIFSKIEGFVSGAEELFKRLELSFEGKGGQPAPLRVGRDPQLENINEGIKQLVDLQKLERTRIGVAG